MSRPLTRPTAGVEPDRPQILQSAAEAIAAGADARDRAARPSFPEDAFMILRDADLLGWNATAGARRPPAAEELALVRTIAAADASVGRIFDGHLNAVERLAVQAPPELRDRELPAFAAGRLRGGVWGADPTVGEGEPARVLTTAAGPRLRGVKTFCSGAGGLDRALILARAPAGDVPVAVWVDVSDPDRIELDRSWYRGAGLRASESHRVLFHDAPIFAQFGPPGALTDEPWFSRDALRTAASWVGMADAALAGALDALAARPRVGELEGLAAGRMIGAHRTMELWLGAGAMAMESGERLGDTALHARQAIGGAARSLLDEAARACGSQPFARGERLDRARRDLELFLLQHRLDPMLACVGLAIVEARR